MCTYVHTYVYVYVCILLLLLAIVIVQCCMLQPCMCLLFCRHLCVLLAIAMQLVIAIVGIPFLLLYIVVDLATYFYGMKLRLTYVCSLLVAMLCIATTGMHTHKSMKSTLKVAILVLEEINSYILNINSIISFH